MRRSFDRVHDAPCEVMSIERLSPGWGTGQVYYFPSGLIYKASRGKSAIEDTTAATL